jgi:EpsI family protein
MGAWRGRDVPLDPAVVRATDTDDHLHREYTSASAGRGVVLYVAYGIRLRDLAPHRPEVCYPSAGWTLENTRIVDVPVVDPSGASGAASVPVQIHTFGRGGLQAARLMVLNYYIVGGDYSADVSLLRSSQWAARESGPTYAAQVQVACVATTNAANAEETVREFAAIAAPVVHSFLDAAVAKAMAGPTTGNP